MARRPKLWERTHGGYGHTVSVRERVAGGPLYLRYWDPTRGVSGNWVWRSLRHSDRELGETEAKLLASQILAVVDNARRGRLTLGALLSRYEREVSKHKKGAQPAEDARRIALWFRFLGADRSVATIDHPTLTRFIRERRAGKIVVLNDDGKTHRKFKANPSDRAIGADLVFLSAACNWACKVTLADGTRLLSENPLRGFTIPANKNVKRPVATFDRFLAVRAKAEQVDPLFGPFLDLIESLGWRVSAVCQLWASDYDRRATPEAPNGRLRKRGDVDKEGVEMWVPLSIDARAALEAGLQLNPTVGDMPLFPAPRAVAGDRPASWSRFYARALLRRAEEAAGLEPLDGGDFHPYRRAWATARKALPAKDVAHAGGWRDLRSLENCYQQVDHATLLTVVTHAAKVRDVKEANGS